MADLGIKKSGLLIDIGRRLPAECPGLRKLSIPQLEMIASALKERDRRVEELAGALKEARGALEWSQVAVLLDRPAYRDLAERIDRALEMAQVGERA